MRNTLRVARKEKSFLLAATVGLMKYSPAASRPSLLPLPLFHYPQRRGKSAFCLLGEKEKGEKVPPLSSPLFLAVSGAITSLRAEGKKTGKRGRASNGRKKKKIVASNIKEERPL